MEKDLSNYRKSYEKGELLLENTPDNPIDLFREWFKDAETHFNIEEANAMSISTIGIDGFPKTRVVLLKKFSHEGFIFFTNYKSEKGSAIAKNPHVCLSFFWHAAERQIIIKGKTEKVPDQLSDQYFNSRPRGSQLGALVSNQSEVIEGREKLESKLTELQSLYETKEVKRPAYWGGYLVKPTEIEFWQGRPNRLHDRIRYLKNSELGWKKDRLAP